MTSRSPVFGGISDYVDINNNNRQSNNKQTNKLTQSINRKEVD